ncbi:GUN4 domain-containing protein [Scytonema sp. PCC 10023]|uniref:GUN4 domain-containing protein n=1 Tax=Scytonema sp. PCC 10023 TaxID=1680591 RepID=UPI0039C63C92
MQLNTAASAPNTDKIQAIQRIAHLKAANLDSKSNLTPPFVYLQKNEEVSSPYLIQQGLSKKGLLGKGLCSQSEIQQTSSIPILNKDLEIFKNQLIHSDYIDRSTKFYSEGGISYKRLRDFLVAGNWKEADRETLAIILKVARREKEGWLNIESINKFPCIELCTIDLFWLKYTLKKHIPSP